ncbi:serine/threonine protein kinase [Chloropicon primus]|uniref:Serine/threonine protein kinase n=2 Tax=Chloropicon primus TaxID=1764295 RepID=A0A5B8MSU9_9CHLO|nr:serine/threonine protein kinase [Chloropicon primus]|eukprot:QDZ23593.1 serine/threonine protein kinase [Chloropicon primus]
MEARVHEEQRPKRMRSQAVRVRGEGVVDDGVGVDDEKGTTLLDLNAQLDAMECTGGTRSTPAPFAKTEGEGEASGRRKGEGERGGESVMLTPESVLGSGLAFKTPPAPSGSQGPAKGGSKGIISGLLKAAKPLPDLETALNIRGDMLESRSQASSGASTKTPSTSNTCNTDGSSFDSPVPTLRTDLAAEFSGGRPSGSVQKDGIRQPPSVLKQRRVYSVLHQEADSDGSGGLGGVLNFGGPINRTSSLDETKVLAATKVPSALLRSESIVIPELFMHMSHFEFTRQIGSSQCSEVWLVKHKYNRRNFAVKQRHFSSKQERDKCKREMQSVADLPPHPNIVFYYRAWQEDSYVFTQMEFCEGGTLKQKLAGAQDESLGTAGGSRRMVLPVGEILRLVGEIALGLSFLEDHGVLHLDIKPENIYLDGEGTYHIGDFGLAVLGQLGWDWEEGDGRYLAPELLDDEAQATSKADVYSFGAVLFESCTGRTIPTNRIELESGSGGGEVPGSFKDLIARELLSCGVPDSLCDMIYPMLSFKPQDRPSAHQLIRWCDEATAT